MTNSKFDNGGDDGKYFREGREQFSISSFSSRAVANTAYWKDTGENLTDEEIDELNANFSDWLDVEWHCWRC